LLIWAECLLCVAVSDTLASHIPPRIGIEAANDASPASLSIASDKTFCWDFIAPTRYIRIMSPDECHQRGQEAKALAAQTQDLWERELLLKIADQWQLLAAHRAAKKPQVVLKLVPGKPDTDR
jgi:hypothetical protein